MKEFVAPEIKIIKLSTFDIIATSSQLSRHQTHTLDGKGVIDWPIASYYDPNFNRFGKIYYKGDFFSEIEKLNERGVHIQLIGEEADIADWAESNLDQEPVGIYLSNKDKELKYLYKEHNNYEQIKQTCRYILFKH